VTPILTVQFRYHSEAEFTQTLIKDKIIAKANTFDHFRYIHDVLSINNVLVNILDETLNEEED
jgi:hypothetical protein